MLPAPGAPSPPVSGFMSSGPTWPDLDVAASLQQSPMAGWVLHLDGWPDGWPAAKLPQQPVLAAHPVPKPSCLGLQHTSDAGAAAAAAVAAVAELAQATAALQQASAAPSSLLPPLREPQPLVPPAASSPVRHWAAGGLPAAPAPEAPEAVAAAAVGGTEGVRQRRMEWALEVQKDLEQKLQSAKAAQQSLQSQLLAHAEFMQSLVMEGSGGPAAPAGCSPALPQQQSLPASPPQQQRARCCGGGAAFPAHSAAPPGTVWVHAQVLGSASDSPVHLVPTPAQRGTGIPIPRQGLQLQSTHSSPPAAVRQAAPLLSNSGGMPPAELGFPGSHLAVAGGAALAHHPPASWQQLHPASTTVWATAGSAGGYEV